MTDSRRDRGRAALVIHQQLVNPDVDLHRTASGICTNHKRDLQVDAMQGKGEERTKVYLNTPREHRSL